MRPFHELDEDALRACSAAKERVWVDLVDPTDEEVDRLADVLGLHPMAEEDSKEFGQRPKLERYDDHLLLVWYGCVDDERGDPQVCEVHVHSTPEVLVTLRRSPSVDLRSLSDELGGRKPGWVLYRVLDELTDSFFAPLDRLESHFDDLEAQVVAGEPLPRAEILRLLRLSVAGRRILEQQRDALVSGSNDLVEAERMGHALREELRDVLDHLERLIQRMMLGHDRLIGIMKVADSASANRLGDQVARLTIVSTIFLPLSVIVGFFGMNFGWLVRNIDSLGAFLGLAIGGSLLSLLAIGWFVRRTGILRGGG